MKAFPTDRLGVLENTRGIGLNESQQDGMDLRDYFAAKMMHKFTFRASGHAGNDEDWALMDARECYRAADAMMKAREL